MAFSESDRTLLRRIFEEVQALRGEEKFTMAANQQLGQQILDAVTAEGTAVDSVLALLQGYIDAAVITPEQGKQLLDAINAEKDKVNAALAANVPAASGTADASPAQTSG